MEPNYTNHSGLVKMSGSEEEAESLNPQVLAQSITIYKIGE